MSRHPLMVFALSGEPPTLRAIADALQEAEHPATVSVGIAGEATETELDDAGWEAAFVRWTEPELHDVWLIERSRLDQDAEAVQVAADVLRKLETVPESSGRLIVRDHLQRTTTLYEITLMPALLADEDHPAWEAVDVCLFAIAEPAEGIIYAEGEAFYDVDGEPLLAIADEGEEDQT